MPYEYFRMKWCLEHGWRPWELDEMAADDFSRWQVMLSVKGEHEERKRKLEEAKERRGVR